MKKTIFIAAIAALAMASSCQKETAPAQDSATDILTFTAVIVDPITKTTVNTDASSASRGKVSWEVNDEIHVTNSNTATYYIKDASDIAADGSANFTYKSGKLPDASATIYRAEYGKEITKEQTYSATAGKLPMEGWSDSKDKTKLYLTVTCGLLKLNLKALSTETDKTISRIEVTGTTTAGKNVTYSLTGNGESIESAKDFYIALPAGNYTEMTFYNKSHYSCHKSAKTAMEIVANKIQPVTLTGITFKTSPSNILPGKFTVNSSGKQVQFTKGNLYYSTTDSKYHIESAQNATYATIGQEKFDSTHVCHFYWTSTTDWQTSGKEPWALTFSSSTYSASDKFFCGAENPLSVDGQSGLYTLTNDEWAYLFKGRANASDLYKQSVTVTTSAGKTSNCVVIAPDGYSGTIAASYDAASWATAEASGLVCLPAGGYHVNEYVSNAENIGGYWSASLVSGIDYHGLYLRFNSSTLLTSDYCYRDNSHSIRLVTDVN